MRRLRTTRQCEHGDTGAQEASAVRFSASSTWISPKMTCLACSPFVSIIICVSISRSAANSAKNRVEFVESHPTAGASVAIFRFSAILLDRERSVIYFTRRAPTTSPKNWWPCFVQGLLNSSHCSTLSCSIFGNELAVRRRDAALRVYEKLQGCRQGVNRTVTGSKKIQVGSANGCAAGQLKALRAACNERAALPRLPRRTNSSR